MIKKSLLLTFLISICLSLIGCGDSPDFITTTGTSGNSAPDESPDQPAGGDDILADTIRQISASVVLPTGMTMNSFPGSTVMSQLVETEVESSGETQVALREGGRVLAIFFDEDEEPVLVGFVTDEQREVSVESTVQASLYVGLGTVLLPLEIRDKFWTEVQSFPGYSQIVSDAEALFRNDPGFFRSSAYQDLMRAYLGELTASEQIGGVNARLVTDGAVKSGLQIEEVGGDAVVVVNTRRRRAHAFVYKMDFTDSSDIKTTLIQDGDFSSAQPSSRKDVPVSPTAAVTSTLGAFQGVASGKGIEFARKESDMIDLSLGPAEKEANYRIRVVGPGTRERPLTSVEQEKVDRLFYETVGVDFILPILIVAVGQDDYFEKYLPNFAANDAFVDNIAQLVAAVPSAEDSLKKGDFKTAVYDIFNARLESIVASSFEGLLKNFIDIIAIGGDAVGSGFSVDQGSRIINDTGSVFKALKAVDGLLQVADWASLVESYVASYKVEDFPIKVTQNKVSLIPESAAVIQGRPKSIQAFIQDGSTTLGAGEAFEYHWSTTGNYGIIRDEFGKSGTSFTSSRDTIEYVGSEGTFPDDAMDEVNVEIVITGPNGTVPVGTADPAKLLVRPRGFEIYPEDAEMMGGTTLPLRVVLTDGSNPFESDVYDYQVVWETPGQFGLFNGVTRSVTEDTTNKVPYEALEEEEDGVESVSVAVYSRLKGETGSFFLEDRINGTVKITNDENKKIFYVSNSIETGQNTDAIFINYFIFNVFDITPVEGAKTYEATIVEHNPGRSYVGRRSSFQADDPNDLTDGVYRIRTSFFSGSIPKDHPDAASDLSARMSEGLASIGAISGLVKVVVTLVP